MEDSGKVREVWNGQGNGGGNMIPLCDMMRREEKGILVVLRFRLLGVEVRV